VGQWYKWKDDAPQYDIEKPDELHAGVIAQEIEKIFPDLVSTMKIGEEENLKVDYTGLSIMLMESIKEVNEMLNEQKQINQDFLKLFNEQKVFNQMMIANIKLVNVAHTTATPTTVGVPAVYVDPSNISPRITNIKPPK
jgi:hypothetical protein